MNELLYYQLASRLVESKKRDGVLLRFGGGLFRFSWVAFCEGVGENETTITASYYYYTAVDVNASKIRVYHRYFSKESQVPPVAACLLLIIIFLWIESEEGFNTYLLVQKTFKT